MSALSVKQRAFRAFEEEGPDARTAREWADEFDTDPSYVYQLRSEFADDADVVDDDPTYPGDEAPTQDPTQGPQDDASDAGVTDGGTDTADGPEPVSVEHEGSEKLSPEGFEDTSTSSIPAPDGVDLNGITPDDLAADPSTDPDPDPDADDAGEPSPEDVVESADDPEERERREDVLDRLRDADHTADAGDSPTPRDAGGLVVDEDLVKTLFGAPFDTAAELTGYDGWELTDAELDANVDLLVAYCRENDVDLSTGSMLAMSLMSTVGPRAVGYLRYRQDDTADTDPPDSPDSAESPSDRTDPEPTPESTDADPAGGFDFENPDTW
jgi:hypothetical protein